MTSSNLALVRANSTIANKYQIVRLIKSGGMGEVYEARHLRLGRRVAIKFLRSSIAQDAAHKARFDREAHTAGSLEHENIAALFDIGSDDHGVPFIVMEYVAGETLRTIIDEAAPLPVPRAIAIALQICAGLQAAHVRGIVHRDLKPDNLMVCTRTDGRDWVKILDFGIARLLHDPTHPDVTATGVVLGTAHYMSPEQARDETIDARSDVYAVGAILYELLCGEKVHPGDTYNTVIYHVLRKEFVPLDSLRPTLPHDLVQAVHRALAAQPAERFASVQDFADTLSIFAKLGRSVSDEETRTGARRVTRPSRVSGWIVGGSIAVALLGGLGYLSLRNETPAAQLDSPAQQGPATPQKPVAMQPPAIPSETTLPTPTATPARVPTAVASSSASAPPPVTPAPVTLRETRVKPTQTSSTARKRSLSPATTSATSNAQPAAVPEGFVENPYGR
jgi:serine/threonine protein kinase